MILTKFTCGWKEFVIYFIFLDSRSGNPETPVFLKGSFIV